MFDFAWSELTVIGVVALVVIGPKDLPKALRAAGQLIRRGRALAREFQNTFDEVIREAELDEIRDNMKKTMAGLEITESRQIGLPAPETPPTTPVLLQGEHLPVSYDVVHDPNEPIEWLDLGPPSKAAQPTTSPTATDARSVDVAHAPGHPPVP